MKDKRGLSGFIWVLIILIILIVGIGIYYLIIYNPNPDCNDSDGGKNYYESGVCYDKTNYVDGGAESCFDRSDGAYLSEMSCKNNQCYREPDHLCSNGCKDGACIK